MSIKFNELWESVDVGKVLSEISSSLRVDYDIEDANECVYAACLRWLERDYTAFSIDSIEETLWVPSDFKAVLDLTGTFTGEGDASVQAGKSYRKQSFRQLKDKLFVLDWKTSKNQLSIDWQRKLEDSWQWRHYLNYTGADIFIYRGIRRRHTVIGEIETREFWIDKSEDKNLVSASNNQLMGIRLLRETLIKGGLVPWPMNRPEACNKYGRICPWYRDCYLGTFPTGTLDKDKQMSYSRMQDFMLCPERARRNELMSLSDTEEEGEGSAAFGAAVHRGLAEVYKQVFKI